jgi:hypothetical protein
MKTINPFLLLIAATAFCVSARGVLGRSLSTELQSTPSAYETPSLQSTTMEYATVSMSTTMVSTTDPQMTTMVDPTAPTPTSSAEIITTIQSSAYETPSLQSTTLVSTTDPQMTTMVNPTAPTSTELIPTIQPSTYETPSLQSTTLDSTTVPQLTTMVNPTAPTAPTLTASASLIPTTLPSTTDTSYILPFYLRLWDICLGGKQMTDVFYINGNIGQWFNVAENKTFDLDPKVNGYPYNLKFGAFDPKLDLLKVGYGGSPYLYPECGEIWRLKHVMAEGCVVCDTAEWSGPPVDCSVTNNPTLTYRNTTMDCKVLLGKPQTSSTSTPAFTLVTTPIITPTATGGAKGLLVDRAPPVTPISVQLTTVTPLIYTTTVSSPNNPSTPEIHRVVPFDIQIWDSCKLDEHVATLVYTNGPIEKQFLPLLHPGEVVDVDMNIPGLNCLKLGPFDSNSGMLKVEYKGAKISDTQCEADYKANKLTDTCVYCSVSQDWDNEPVDCNKFSHWRYKKMFCQVYVVPEKTT